VADKIAMFCHVPVANVLAVHDCNSVYHVPLLLRDQGASLCLTIGLVQVLQKRLGLGTDMSNHVLLRQWQHLTTRIERLHDTVSVVLVGKYTSLKDSYISVVKSLEHAALSCSRRFGTRGLISCALMN
jgi:CTP synthase